KSGISKQSSRKVPSPRAAGPRSHKLLQTLTAAAPPPALSAQSKRRAKRAGKAAVLGAVGGIAASLDELMAASDAKVARSSSTPAQDGGVSLSSKKR
ncbi:MAG: hypothetical protein SGPRY_011191, partial [Prymnesium sp.]